MKSITSTLALFTVLPIVLLSLTVSQAADIVLRERSTRIGAIVRLGDIADIAAETPAERKRLASTPLLPAPAKGTVQYLTVSQIRDLLTARGVRLDQLSIGGERIVELGVAASPLRSGSSRSIDGPTRNSAAQNPTPQELKLRVQQAIERYLEHNTSVGHWRVEVLLHKLDTARFDGLHGNLIARGQSKLRSGRQKFFLSDANGGREVSISAKLIQVQSVIVARRRVEKGQLVRAADVEIREQEGNLPSQSLVALEQAIGKEAQRTLRAEAIVRESDLRAPWQVRRGESVNVFVRTGGIVVRARAVAKQNGSMGELITVETPEKKQKLSASVSGPGEVTIYATGGRTTDYALLRRDERQY